MFHYRIGSSPYPQTVDFAGESLAGTNTLAYYEHLISLKNVGIPANFDLKYIWNVLPLSFEHRDICAQIYTGAVFLTVCDPSMNEL
jgi:hypothetical protein